jgi:hypothetical protein
MKTNEVKYFIESHLFSGNFIHKIENINVYQRDMEEMNMNYE